MRNYYENRESIARKMMKEALPDVREVIECTPIKYIPASKWVQGRDEVAEACGESKHKRELIEKELRHSETVAGEFINGSKGQAIVFKTAVVTNRKFHIEAIMHEWAHGYCAAAEKKDDYIPAEFKAANFPNDEIQYGYNMWKEFATQGICKKICAKNNFLREDDIIGELGWYLEEIVYNLSGEGNIGMFFANLFFDGRLDKNIDRKALLCELLKDYDGDTRIYFLELYALLQGKLQEKEFWRTDVESLEELGGFIGTLKYAAQVNQVMKCLNTYHCSPA